MVPNRPVMQVPDEDAALVIALIHLNQDGLAPLIGFGDVHRILKSGRSEPAAVASMLKTEGLGVHGHMTMRAVEKVLSIPTHLSGQNELSAWWWPLLWPESIYPYSQVNSKRRRRASAYAMRFSATGRKMEALRWAFRRLLRAASAGGGSFDS